ncbi:MAG: tail fiber domain-containing protein [Flavobacteriales bacterium]|nr:tail fiber domain-containing protein [Flavobacteriales bacterium]
MQASGISGTNVYGVDATAQGQSYSTNAYAVQGYADGATATNFGTRGVAAGTSTNYGAFGRALNGSINYGVYGMAPDTSTNNWAGYFVGKVRVTGNAHIANLIIGSDQMLKTNIQDLQDAGSIVAQLSPRTYEFIPGLHANLYPPNGAQIGLIAQEVEQVLPQLVETVTDAAAYDDQGNMLSPALTTKGINYIGLIPVLIGAMKEQQATIAEQNARLDAMEQDLAACCEGRAMMQTPGGGNGTDGTANGELRASDAERAPSPSPRTPSARAR